MTALKDRVLVALCVLALSPTLLLPYAAAVRLYGFLGGVGLGLTPFRARVTRNLAHVGLGLDPRSVIAGVGDNFARVLVEYARIASFAAQPGLRHVTGLEHLRAAMAAGRGAVILSAHFGNWEAIRLAARDAGVEVGVIYRRYNNPHFDRIVAARLAMAGGPVLCKGLSGQRDMLRHLRRGGAILVLIDQRVSEGQAIDFLGRPAMTATALAALAAKTGAALIPAMAMRRADGVSFDVAFDAPVTGAEPVAAMQAVHARFAVWIGRAPGQWLWLHRRWKGLGG